MVSYRNHRERIVTVTVLVVYTSEGLILGVEFTGNKRKHMELGSVDHLNHTLGCPSCGGAIIVGRRAYCCKA